MTHELIETLDAAAAKERLRSFARARDWEQFHDPKNLTMALGVEVAELAEHFQWLTNEQARELAAEGGTPDVCDELADVAIYLLRLADVLGVDLGAAVTSKIDRNETRFPPTG